MGGSIRSTVITTNIIQYTDPGAPELNGEVGSLIAVLDFALVTTAGWTKQYTSTNAADYRQAALGGNASRFYWHVDDNGPGAAVAKEARVRGYEAMTAYDTGTSPFPTAAQSANGFVIRKSTQADATGRPWLIGVDEKTCYLWIETGDTVGRWYDYAFGDIFTYKSSDPAPCVLIARVTENGASVLENGLDRLAVRPGNGVTVGAGGITPGYALARPISGAFAPVTGVNLSLIGDTGLMVTSSNEVTVGAIDYANPADNLAYVADIRLVENTGTTAGAVRGRLRGLMHFCHPATSASNGDVIPGTLDLAGRSYRVVKPTANNRILLLEQSNTWDTN